MKDGRVLVAGGQSASGATNTLEIFSPDTNSFAAVTSAMLSVARQQHAAAVLADGRVLIAGGSDGTDALNSADIFDPSSGSIAAAGLMSTPRASLSATTLLDGTVLIAGGNNGLADLASAEIYDSTAKAFSVTGNLATGRSGHVAFLLPNNNEVLIAGGTSAGTALSSAELFVPWTGTFVSTGALGGARRSAAGSSLTQEGQLLIAGGTDGSNALGSGELFNFATVTTDASDYPPGTTVNISGSGWQPGETVNLTLVESPLYDTHGPYTAVADTNGKIFNNQFATDPNDLNIRFYLTAKGSVSQAQMTFTDGNATSVGGNVRDNSGNPISGATIACTSGCNNTPQASTSSGSDGSYIFTGSNKLSFNTNGPVTIQLTASKSGYTSATITLTQVNNGDTLSGKNFALTPSSTATTTTVTSSANPSTYGSSITFTAKVAPGSGTVVPTGTVQFAIDSVPFGSPVTVSSCSPAPDACANTAAISTLTATNHSISASYNPTGGFTSSQGSLTQGVNKAPLMVTANDASRSYGDANPTLGGTISNNPDNITASYASAATTTTEAGTYGPASVNAIIPTLSDPGNKLGNYTVTSTKGTLTINPAVLTITAKDASRSYGDANPAFDGAITGQKNGDIFTATYATVATATSDVGTFDITVDTVVATAPAKLSNYTVTKNKGTLTITARPVRVSADAKEKVYGATDPAFTYQITSGTLATGDAFSGALVRDAGENVGPYAIKQGTLTLSNNYTLTYTGASLTITPATLTITPDGGKTKTYGSVFSVFTGTKLGLQNNDAVTVSYGSTGALAVAGVGSYDITVATITFTQGSASNYNVVKNTATNGLTVTPATLTITPDGNKTKILGAPFTAFTGTNTGLQNGDTITVTYASLGAPASAAVGTYDISIASVTFTSGSASNYSIMKNTASKGLTVSYNGCLLYDPTRAVKGGATYPIKLYLCDANSVDVSSPAVVVSATTLYKVAGGTGNVEDAGNANPDSNFRYDATLGPSGGYIFNFKTSGLGTGSYNLIFTAGGASNPSYSAGFGVK